MALVIKLNDWNISGFNNLWNSFVGIGQNLEASRFQATQNFRAIKYIFLKIRWKEITFSNKKQCGWNFKTRLMQMWLLAAAAWSFWMAGQDGLERHKRDCDLWETIPKPKRVKTSQNSCCVLRFLELLAFFPWIWFHHCPYMSQSQKWQIMNTRDNGFLKAMCDVCVQ